MLPEPTNPGDNPPVHTRNLEETRIRPFLPGQLLPDPRASRRSRT